MYNVFLSSLLAENQISSVNRGMFRGLSNLQSLSLYGNIISCVTNHNIDQLKRKIVQTQHLEAKIQHALKTKALRELSVNTSLRRFVKVDD